jgi:hypothetical protein
MSFRLRIRSRRRAGARVVPSKNNSGIRRDAVQCAPVMGSSVRLATSIRLGMLGAAAGSSGR